MSDSGTQDGTASKLIWMIVSAVATALVAIPVSYYFIGPLTPKAAVTSALQAAPGRFTDRSGHTANYQAGARLPGDRLYDNDAPWFIYIYVKNIDSRLPAKDVTVEFELSRPKPDPSSHRFTDTLEKYVGIEPSRCCRDTTTEKYHSSPTNINFDFVCGLINPLEYHRFDFVTPGGLLQKIKVSMIYEGYSSRAEYTLCRDINDASLLFYANGSRC